MKKVLSSPEYGARMATTHSGDEAVDHEAPAPNLGPSTDVTLGDETMELIAYGDLEGAKARHDGSGATKATPAKS